MSGLPGHIYGDVAQLGERSVRNAEVAGSTPVVSTFLCPRKYWISAESQYLCGFFPSIYDFCDCIFANKNEKVTCYILSSHVG